MPSPRPTPHSRDAFKLERGKGPARRRGAVDRGRPLRTVIGRPMWHASGTADEYNRPWSFARRSLLPRWQAVADGAAAALRFIPQPFLPSAATTFSFRGLPSNGQPCGSRPHGSLRRQNAEIIEGRPTERHRVSGMGSYDQAGVVLVAETTIRQPYSAGPRSTLRLWSLAGTDSARENSRLLSFRSQGDTASAS